MSDWTSYQSQFSNTNINILLSGRRRVSFLLDRFKEELLLTSGLFQSHLLGIMRSQTHEILGYRWLLTFLIFILNLFYWRNVNHRIFINLFFNKWACKVEVLVVLLVLDNVIEVDVMTLSHKLIDQHWSKFSCWTEGNISLILIILHIIFMKSIETKSWSELEIAILKLCIAVYGVGKWEMLRS